MSRYIYHNHGINPCGNKAAEFLPNTGPEIEQSLIAEEWLKLNGEPFNHGDRFICGSCGNEVQAVVEDVRDDGQCS